MRRVGLALALALLLPASASAQTPPPVPVPPTPVPTPVPPPAADAALTLSATDVFLGSRRVALTGRSFTARVVLRPYVAGEQVTVRVYRGKRKLRAKALTVQP